MMALNNSHVPQTPPSSHHQQNSSPHTPGSIRSSLLTMSSLSSSDVESAQGPVSCNDDDDEEYFSEPFFTPEELNSVDGLGTYAPPVISTGFKEDDPYIKATNDMRRNLLPGDSGTCGQYYVVLNSRTCGVHRGWDATTKLVLNFMSASFFRADSRSDTEESWQDAFLEDRIGPPGYQHHEAIEQEGTLPPRTPPSSPRYSATGRCGHHGEYATTSHSTPSSPSSSSNARKQSQSSKAGSSASVSTLKTYTPTPGSSHAIPPLLQKDIWERVPAYWVVTKGHHPGVFHGINTARQAGAEPDSIIKAATTEQACMRFVQAFMDGKISQM